MKKILLFLLSLTLFFNGLKAMSYPPLDDSYRMTYEECGPKLPFLRESNKAFLIRAEQKICKEAEIESSIDDIINDREIKLLLRLIDMYGFKEMNLSYEYLLSIKHYIEEYFVRKYGEFGKVFYEVYMNRSTNR